MARAAGPFSLRQGLLPDGRDYWLGDSGGPQRQRLRGVKPGSKARPAVYAEDAPWRNRKSNTNHRARYSDLAYSKAL